MGRWGRISFGPVGAGLLVLTSAAPVQAQEPGVVSGTVRDAASGQSLESAQVYIDTLNRGALTNSQGRYLLAEIPGGTHELRVELIGYTPRKQSVTVVSGQAVEVNFELQATPLRLQELVVTGVAGETPRVKLPFTVGKVLYEDMPVPAPSAEGLIYGKVAGAKLVRGSGQPGEAAGILLRGPTTITGTQDPLIIVDGVITDNSLADIGSLDVESIEIVKGAAAASFYGSRAQNGVIQIRTRRGQDLPAGQNRFVSRVEYGRQFLGRKISRARSHSFGVDDQGNILDVQGKVVHDLLTHTEITGTDVQQTNWLDKPFPDYIPLYDHLSQLFDPGAYTSYYTAVEGRTGSTNYRGSFTYRDEEGVVPDFNEGAQLKGFRLNVDHRVRNSLDIGISSYYAQATQENLALPDGFSSPFMFLAHQRPFVDLLRRDSTTIGLPYCPERGCLVDVAHAFTNEANPLYSLELVEDWDHRSRFMGSANVAWSPLAWFELEGVFSLDRSDLFRSNIVPRGSTQENSTSQGSIYKAQSISNDLNASVTAAVNRAFGDLTTRTRLRILMEDQHSEDFSVRGIETQSYQIPVLDNASQFSGGSSIYDIRSEGYFLISALDYRGKYMGDFLVRRDGSSLFGPEERWQTYYRASGAWRLAQEGWWPFEDINELKLRFSLGTAGGRPAFSAQYETYDVSARGIFPTTLGNKNLKPELTTEREAAIETVFFDKVSAGAVYAWSTTEDQLLEQPLLASYGFPTQWVNAGTIESNTLEMYLDAALLDSPNFSWFSRLNFDRTRQKITKLDVPPYRTGSFYVREGEALGTFYGNRWATECSHLPAGADCSQFQVNDDGLLVWVGSGNDYTEGFSKDLWFTSDTLVTPNGDTTVYDWGYPIKAIGKDYRGEDTEFLALGNTTPRFNLSWGNHIRWKNLILYVLFDTESGADVYNQTRQLAYRSDLSGDQDQRGKPDELKKPIDYYQVLYNVFERNSWFVEDGTFVKLREMSLGYVFDPDRVRGWFGGGLGLDGLSVNVIARNLFTWTNYRGYDPEVGTGDVGSGGGSPAIGRVDAYQYPNFRTISVSIETVF